MAKKPMARPMPAQAKGNLTVREAGRLGGEKVLQERGVEFYSEIGQKGGQKVRELIERGKQAAAEQPPRRR
jgi:general stress protein YciG